MQSVFVIHRDPDAVKRLCAEVQAVPGLAAIVLPSDPSSLERELAAASPDGLFLVDVDLVGTIRSTVASRDGRVMALTPIQGDPRDARLKELGISLVHLDQVNAFLSRLARSPGGRHGEQQAEEGAGAQIIVLHAAKGGVGTTTLAVHLATVMAQMGRRVLLVDIAPYGATAVHCKVHQDRSGMEGLIQALERETDLLERAESDLSRFVTHIDGPQSRFDLLGGAGPRSIDRLRPSVIPKMLHRLGRFDYDVLLVDTSAEPTPRNLAALCAANRGLLVGTTEFASAWNLIRLQAVLDLVRPEGELALVLNRVGMGYGVAEQHLAERLRIAQIAGLPDDPQLPSLTSHGRPWELSNQSAYRAGVFQLAQLLVGGGAEVYG